MFKKKRSVKSVNNVFYTVSSPLHKGVKELDFKVSKKKRRVKCV